MATKYTLEQKYDYFFDKNVLSACEHHTRNYDSILIKRLRANKI